jgi:exosome complex exonuclease RRP6
MSLIFVSPIPEEMFFYARADTHFLLYIYDNIRNELIDRTNPEIPEENRMEMVLQKSKETSLLRYERQIYNSDSGKGPGGWYQLLAKTPALFSNEQFAVFRAVHEWRDKIARVDDDSTAFVMPNHVIFSLAKLMPMDMVALLGIAHPISYSVKSRSGELLAVVKSAKARGKDGPSMMDVLRPDTVGAALKASLPATAALAATPALLAEIDESELRSEKSSFWGGAFGSSVWDSPKAISNDDSLRLAVPLPALSSEIFASSTASNGLTNRPRAVEEAPVQLTPISSQAPKEEEPFIIKRGAKRKSDAISDLEEETGGEYDISLNDIDSDSEAVQKAEQKRQRKAEKKRRKAEKRAAAESVMAVDEEDDDEPFDYSKAESVLHGKKREGEKGKKPFDPYQKSADAPKGVRRVQTERAGRSHTFKS